PAPVERHLLDGGAGGEGQHGVPVERDLVLDPGQHLAEEHLRAGVPQVLWGEETECAHEDMVPRQRRARATSSLTLRTTPSARKSAGSSTAPGPAVTDTVARSPGSRSSI